MLDFLFALIELFSLSITVPEYKAKCVQLGCFCRGHLFALKCYLDRVVPQQPFMTSEN